MLFSAETWWKQSLVTSEKSSSPTTFFSSKLHLLSNVYRNILEYITVLWLGNNHSELKGIAICYDLIPLIYTSVPLVESFRTISHSSGCTVHWLPHPAVCILLPLPSLCKACANGLVRLRYWKSEVGHPWSKLRAIHNWTHQHILSLVNDLQRG